MPSSRVGAGAAPFHQHGRDQQQAGADRHLQPDDHHHVTAAPGPARRQRGKGQRHHADQAQDHPRHVQPVPEPHPHDQRDAGHPRDQPGHGDGAQPLGIEQPAQEGHGQRHHRGDDGRDGCLDILHRDPAEAQVKRVLAQAEQDHRAKSSKIPADKIKQNKLSYSLGFKTLDEYMKRLDEVIHSNKNYFQILFNK